MAEALRLKRAAEIQSLLTPQYILDKNPIPIPEQIHPQIYPTFDTLLIERKRIRDLHLLPVRTENRRNYQSQPPEQLRDQIESYLEDVDFALRRNPYPYDLSPDIGQHIIWLKNKDSSPEAISEFLASSLGVMNKKPDRIILFEKSYRTQTDIARGTYPHRRHIHMLVEKPNRPTFPPGRQGFTN